MRNCNGKNVCGAHKDRHANIGFGEIGFEALDYIAHHPQIEGIPTILETPYVGSDKKTAKAPYGKEIAMLRVRQFDPNVFSDLF